MTGNNILNFYTGLKEQSFSPNILTRKFTLFAVKFCFSINDCKIPICKLQKMPLVIWSPWHSIFLLPSGPTYLCTETETAKIIISTLQY